MTLRAITSRLLMAAALLSACGPSGISANHDYGVLLAGASWVNHDSVVRNVFRGNTSGPLHDEGSFDVIGPPDNDGTSSQPWSNLAY